MTFKDKVSGLVRSTLDLQFDPISTSDWLNQQLPEAVRGSESRKRLLDLLLNLRIPFNRWLGLKVREFTPDSVTIESPPSVLRRNHVGTAHACAQALIGEFAAGLVVAQKFALEEYRMIIGRLDIEYRKAGRGVLLGKARAPEAWPDLVDGEGWVPMVTHITTDEGEIVAICKTSWQVKSWRRIAEQKKA